MSRSHENTGTRSRSEVSGRTGPALGALAAAAMATKALTYARHLSTGEGEVTPLALSRTSTHSRTLGGPNCRTLRNPGRSESPALWS